VLANEKSIEYYVLMINSLQMTIYLPLIQITPPGNVILFMQILRPLVMFDLMEMFEKFDITMESLFDFDLDQ
jgi:hypothetical protein